MESIPISGLQGSYYILYIYIFPIVSYFGFKAEEEAL